jgi:hypothetical protein
VSEEFPDRRKLVEAIPEPAGRQIERKFARPLLRPAAAPDAMQARMPRSNQ